VAEKGNIFKAENVLPAIRSSSRINTGNFLQNRIANYAYRLVSPLLSLIAPNLKLPHILIAYAF